MRLRKFSLVFALCFSLAAGNIFPIPLGQASPPEQSQAIFIHQDSETPLVENSVQVNSFPIRIRRYNVQITGAVPLNLAQDSQGHIWFTNANSHLALFNLGELNPLTAQVTVRSVQLNIRRVHYLGIDASDRVWYVTTYGGINDVLGVYNPAADQFTEWSSSQFLGLYGLYVDQQREEVWFLGTEPDPQIFRFKPATGILTAWPIAGYIWAYDLVLDANGDVWVTDIPWLGGETGLSTILRLDPIKDILNAWELPDATTGPFKINASLPGEVWFSEYQTSTNNLARLDLSTDDYEQFDVPAANSYPGSLGVRVSQVWFNAPGIFSVGKLELQDLAPGTITSLTPSESNANPTNPTLTSTVYDNTQFRTDNYLLPNPATFQEAGSQTDNFSIYPAHTTGCSIPAEGAWAHGILPASGASWWFSGCNYLGVFLELNKIWLPVVFRP